MAANNRVTVTINGTKFNAACASVKFSTQVDQTGTAVMGSLASEIRVFANFHDTANLPFSALQSFFNLANVVTLQNIVPMQIDYWKDDSAQDVLYSYKFNGWIARFETVNPSSATSNLNLDGDSAELQYQGITPTLNHMLILDLQPAMNQANYASVSMSN
ncbi:MAG TPA: hypothetical protein VMB85_07900 [Bryobacteraceae bacterium]|jgi:hypothetical protein|nr:hypothetical protein [Bryobacteraceae bacterium]